MHGIINPATDLTKREACVRSVISATKTRTAWKKIKRWGGRRSIAWSSASSRNQQTCFVAANVCVGKNGLWLCHLGRFKTCGINLGWRLQTSDLESWFEQQQTSIFYPFCQRRYTVVRHIYPRFSRVDRISCPFPRETSRPDVCACATFCTGSWRGLAESGGRAILARNFSRHAHCVLPDVNQRDGGFQSVSPRFISDFSNRCHCLVVEEAEIETAQGSRCGFWSVRLPREIMWWHRAHRSWVHDHRNQTRQVNNSAAIP